MSAVGIAVAVFLHEELLECDFASKTGLLGKIGYTETALTEYFFNLVISTLQQSTFP